VQRIEGRRLKAEEKVKVEVEEKAEDKVKVEVEDKVKE